MCYIVIVSLFWLVHVLHCFCFKKKCGHICQCIWLEGGGRYGWIPPLDPPVNACHCWQVSEIVHLSPIICPKRWHSGVCQDSFTSSSKTIHWHTEVVRWLSFLLPRHLISWVAYCWHGEQFFISEPDEVHRWSRVASQQLTELVEMSKLVVTTHVMTSQLAKNI